MTNPKMITCNKCGKEIKAQGSYMHILNCKGKQKKPEKEEAIEDKIKKDKKKEENSDISDIEQFLIDDDDDEIDNDKNLKNEINDEDEDKKPLSKNFIALIVTSTISMILLVGLLVLKSKKPKQKKMIPQLGRNLNMSKIN